MCVSVFMFELIFGRSGLYFFCSEKVCVKNFLMGLEHLTLFLYAFHKQYYAIDCTEIDRITVYVIIL